MTCQFCGTQLNSRTLYFCRPHWFELPAKERMQLHHMYRHKQDVTSKVAKCVRILKEKHA